MWKTHPSGAWSRLKLTLYVICRANSNHREIIFVATANPLKVSLSLCLILCVHHTFVFFFLFFYYFTFKMPLFFMSFLSFASFSHCFCHFLLLWLSLSLFFRLVVTSSLSSMFCHFSRGSCLLHTVIYTHTHPNSQAHTNTDINKSSL